jgi:hypothetical protein
MKYTVKKILSNSGADNGGAELNVVGIETVLNAMVFVSAPGFEHGFLTVYAQLYRLRYRIHRNYFSARSVRKLWHTGTLVMYKMYKDYFLYPE